MIADRLRQALDARSETSTLSNPAEWLAEALGGVPTYSGKKVTPGSAMGLIPYFSGVSRIAGAIGSLPMIVYSTAGDLRERAEGTDQWRILHDKPNAEMTADQMFELSQALLLNWGNSFAWKERSARGTIGELWPISCDRVHVFRDDNGTKRYLIDGGTTGIQPLTNEDILHIPGLGFDGLVGYSPIQLARQELGTMLALQEFAGRVWKNSAVPIGVLQSPNKLSEEAYKRVRKSWDKLMRGSRNFGKTGILEEGLTWQSMGMPLEDAQFIESQKLGDLRSAQLLCLPPYMIGAETPNSFTYSTSEMEGMDFVRYTLRRWLVRHQNTIRLDPVIFPPRLNLTCEFLVDAFLQADVKTRTETWAMKLDRGAATINEWRRSDNEPPVPWGNEPFKPLKADTSNSNGNGNGHTAQLSEAELEAILDKAETVNGSR